MAIADHVWHNFPSGFLLSHHKHELKIVFYMSKYLNVLNWRQLFLGRRIFEIGQILKSMISHTAVLYILVFLCTFLYTNRPINLLISINWNGRISCVSISLFLSVDPRFELMCHSQGIKYISLR